MFNDSAINTNISGKARIKVIGVGGAGNNAINRMIEARISCTEYVVVNTDSQILALSPCENKIQIGTQLTKGLGAGADPDVGRAAAEESKDILTEVIKGTDLLFITAGMGGGTGTGAAPVIAKIARDMKILTVAVVTEPFAFEGKKRMENTVKGLDNLKKYVDTLIVIPNDKIRTVVDKNTTMVEALRVADEILKQGIKGLAELIVNPALINLDFADVKTILKDRGIAHLGVGVAKGDNRIIEAVRVAVNCPLLETTIEGAQGVILNVVGGNDLTFAEVADAAELVRSVVDASANIIFGARIDPNVQDEVEITVIATGFPGYENTQREEQQRAYTNGQLYNQQPYSQGRMSVNEPYYPQQRIAPQPIQPAQPPVRGYQPIQQQPVVQQPLSQQYAQPEQPAVRPAVQEPQVERPSDKTVPKFAQLLHRFNRRNDGE
ncbi:MAG: cell division protein FtsZ [Clostridia bacterium]|nr:cell division protein FtsZ [Clostridia bacterium]